MALAGYLQFAQANEAFRRAVALTPDDVESWNQLALGLALEGQYDAALEAAQAALRLTPNDAGLQLFHIKLLNPSTRKSFFDGLRSYTWKEYLEKAHGIKSDT
jgi:tetratricopeptide (TPR) repeat protein